MIKKICGLTRPLDVAQAVQWGANAVGFVLYRGSPRYVTAEQVRHCTQNIAPRVLRVGVFVHPASDVSTDVSQDVSQKMAAQVCRTAEAAGLTVVQLHGQESPAFCRQVRQHFTVWKALSTVSLRQPSSETDLGLYEDSVDAFLVDHRLPQADLWGGTGQTCSWSQAAQVVKSTSRPVILAGGLHRDNVQAALEQVRPAGVDASSCLETAPGKKDAHALRAFLEALPSGSLTTPSGTPLGTPLTTPSTKIYTLKG
jgi:phosphoribosylanthranilate isomerase